MRALAAVMGFCLMGLAMAEEAAPPAESAAERPKVYALIAAIGDRFSVVTEVSRTGTHLSPFERRTTQIPGDILNRLALNSLDQAIAKADPTSRRIYMALPAPPMQGVAPSERDKVAISRITAALEKMPQRLEWDQIVIATPAYRALELNGLSGRLQGFGLFVETQCQAACGGFRSEDAVRQIMREPPDGVDAITSEDKAIKARTFMAPFSYISVWVLDAKTLAVLDVQEGFDSQKLAEPPDKPLTERDAQKYVAMRIANLIDASVSTAVSRSEATLRRGVVEVGPFKLVPPDSEPKK